MLLHTLYTFYLDRMFGQSRLQLVDGRPACFLFPLPFPVVVSNPDQVPDGPVGGGGEVGPGKGGDP